MAALDAATLAGWAAHPHLAVIGSQVSFAAKIDRARAAVLGLLGDRDPVEIERKFALDAAADMSDQILAGAVRADIEQVDAVGPA